MNSNPRITFQRKLYVNRRGASGLVTYTNSYCTQQRKETRPMKTDVTGGHSETHVCVAAFSVNEPVCISRARSQSDSGRRH